MQSAYGSNISFPDALSLDTGAASFTASILEPATFATFFDRLFM
jgi:hypothetical protein